MAERLVDDEFMTASEEASSDFMVDNGPYEKEFTTAWRLLDGSADSSRPRQLAHALLTSNISSEMRDCKSKNAILKYGRDLMNSATRLGEACTELVKEVVINMVGDPVNMALTLLANGQRLIPTANVEANLIKLRKREAKENAKKHAIEDRES